jgi:hypothetical protein
MWYGPLGVGIDSMNFHPRAAWHHATVAPASELASSVCDMNPDRSDRGAGAAGTGAGLLRAAGFLPGGLLVAGFRAAGFLFGADFFRAVDFLPLVLAPRVVAFLRAPGFLAAIFFFVVFLERPFAVFLAAIGVSEVVGCRESLIVER